MDLAFYYLFLLFNSSFEVNLVLSYVFFYCDTFNAFIIEFNFALSLFILFMIFGKFANYLKENLTLN